MIVEGLRGTQVDAHDSLCGAPVAIPRCGGSVAAHFCPLYCSLLSGANQQCQKTSAAGRGEAVGRVASVGKWHIGRFAAIWIVFTVGRSGSYLDEASGYARSTGDAGIESKRYYRCRARSDRICGNRFMVA